jgi:DNA-binding XRE family transcriptional regulator
MKAQKAYYFDEWLKEKLKDKKFREHYEHAQLAAQIAHAITMLRRKLGITQSELARRMGTKQQTVSRLESGEYEGFTLKTLVKLAEATRSRLTISFEPSRRRKAKAG